MSPINLKLVSIPGNTSMMPKSTSCAAFTISLLKVHVFLSEDFLTASKTRKPISAATKMISSKVAILIPVPSLIWAEYIEETGAVQQVSG